LREHAAYLERAGFRCSVGNGELTAVGDLQPLRINACYRVRLTYRPGSRPRVFVEDPPLRARPDERIPHVWGPDEPCCFDPRRPDWERYMPLAHSVIPWLAKWLFFYEAWLVTGKWLGGGADHASPRAAA
jgi:hypothetical protein